MSDEAKTATAIILAAAFGLVALASSIAWPIAWYNYSVQAAAFREGYETTSLPGVPGTHWVKKGEKR